MGKVGSARTAPRLVSEEHGMPHQQIITLGGAAFSALPESSSERFM